MSTTYNLDLVFRGHDQVTGVLGGIVNGFSRMGTIAGGIIASRALFGIAEGLKEIAVNAVEATATVQRMQITLESLLAREYINKALEKNSDSTVAYGEAISAVIPKADELMEKLANMAILSPYTYEGVTQTYRQAMAFGFAADEAELFTKATLNMAAGIGADTSMLDRMAYNLAQVRLQGKVTALDVRQLALAGFDLVSVLKYVGKATHTNVKNIKDFNTAIKSGQITWEDFTTYYAEYADKYFGGASERLARSLYGLKTTFQDVFALTMPKVLGPASEAVTVFLNTILNKFIALRESGVLDEIGQRWGVATQKWIQNLESVVERLGWVSMILKAGGGKFGELIARAFQMPPEVGDAIDRIIAKIQYLRDRFAELTSQLPPVNIWDLLGKGIIFVADNFDRLAGALAVISAGRLIGVIAGIAGAILGLAASILSPINLIIAGVALLYTAWTQNWGGIQEKVASAWTSIQTVLQSIGAILAEVWAVIKPFVDDIGAEFSEHLPGLIAAGLSIFNTLKATFIAVFDALGPPFQRFWIMIQKVWPQIVEAFGQGLEFFKYFGLILAGVIAFVIGIVVGLIDGIMNAAASLITSFYNIRENIVGIFQGLGDILAGVWNFIAGIFTLNGERILQGLIQFFTGIWSVLSNLFMGILNIVAAPLGMLIGLISGFIEGVIGFFQSLYNTLVGGSIVPDLVNGIILLFQQLAEFLTSIVSNVIGGLLSAFQAVADAIGSVLVSAFTLLMDIVAQAKNALAQLVSFLTNALTNAINTAVNLVNKLITAVGNLIKKLAQLIIPAALREKSPSPLAQSLMNATQAFQGLTVATQTFNAENSRVALGTLNPKAEAQAAWRTGVGTPESGKTVNFYFNDTSLDLQSLTYAMNRIQDV